MKKGKSQMGIFIIASLSHFLRVDLFAAIAFPCWNFFLLFTYDLHVWMAANEFIRLISLN